MDPVFKVHIAEFIRDYYPDTTSTPPPPLPFPDSRARRRLVFYIGRDQAVLVVTEVHCRDGLFRIGQVHVSLGMAGHVVHDEDTGSAVNDFVVVQEKTIVTGPDGQPEKVLRFQGLYLARVRLRHDAASDRARKTDKYVTDNENHCVCST